MHDSTLPMKRLTEAPGEAAGEGGNGARWRMVSRLLAGERKAKAQDAMRQGRVRELERVELLAQAGLERLAVRSLWLLLGSAAGFVGLDVASRLAHGSGPLLGTGPLWARGGGLILANAASYAAILPVHEGVHALVILALGGRPHFGLKLPLAAYCTAPEQVFTRNGYLTVLLAPLVALSAVGAAVTWIAPDVGACLLLALAGNVAGAVADLSAAARVRRLPGDALVLDTEDGYLAVRAV